MTADGPTAERTTEGRTVDGSTGEPADPLIDVKEVALSYDDVEVLDGVSLSVRAGEFVGLVGPNGAGKTTLLRTVNGVLSPDAGTVTVDGDPIGSLSSQAVSRRVATVPQDTTVAFDFPVEDIVEMGRTPYHDRLRGDPEAAAAVERALERTETTEFRERPVGSLSGGERQRVVLARALAQETPALVLDEPTGSLDVNHQVRTLELVRELADEGKAVLAAIHDLDLAARFCDRIAVLHDGQVLATGPPAGVLTGDRLRTAFGTEAAVLPNPVTGTPSVTPLASREERDLTVHVAGTGAVAARAIARLVETGAAVTAGVLPADGLAALTADELDVEAVTAPPFESVSPEAVSTVRSHLDAAEAVVLAGTVPDRVRDLVAEHDAVVRVGTDEAAGAAALDLDESAGVESDTGAGDAVAHRAEGVDESAPGAVVEAVRRLRGTTGEADD